MEDRNEQMGGRGLGRRELLCTAASGFVLAASGLILPERLVETAAAEGALSGALGGRHGKNRRGRDKRNRRTHGDKKNNKGNNPPRAGGPRAIDVAIRVRNFRDAPVDVQGWSGGWSAGGADAFRVGDGWDWSTLPAKPATGPEASKDFVGSYREVAVRIGASHAVHCYLGWDIVGAAIWTGGWGGAGHDPQATNLARRDQLAVDASISAAGITVTRVEDSETHKWYIVDLT